MRKVINLWVCAYSTCPDPISVTATIGIAPRLQALPPCRRPGLPWLSLTESVRLFRDLLPSFAVQRICPLPCSNDRRRKRIFGRHGREKHQPRQQLRRAPRQPLDNNLLLYDLP